MSWTSRIQFSIAVLASRVILSMVVTIPLLRANCGAIVWLQWSHPTLTFLVSPRSNVLLRIVAARSAGYSQETFCTSPSNFYSGLMSLTEVVHWRFRCRVCMSGLLVSPAPFGVFLLYHYSRSCAGPLVVATYLSVVAKRTVDLTLHQSQRAGRLFFELVYCHHTSPSDNADGSHATLSQVGRLIFQFASAQFFYWFRLMGGAKKSRVAW